MEAESSDLDYANGTTISGAAVPGLRTKRVQNIVELGEGQTMSVAGLLDDTVVASKQAVPGLGDLPIIGQLFRSTRYQRKETELVVLITPRLAGAMNPGQVPPLPGAGWRHPSELEQFAFGDLGGNSDADAIKDWNKHPSDRGANPPSKVGGLEQSGRIANAGSRQGRDPNLPPPTFIGDHGFAPAPRRDESTAVATVKE
jgi:pilus assembly protein CpaC